MTHEVDIYGVFVPTLLVWLLAAYALGVSLRPVLRRAGVYRMVWHPALFDFALFVCVLGGVVYLALECLS